MKTLILMMGIPGSGKSTYLAKANKIKHRKIISRDQIRFSMIETGDYFSKEKEVFNEYINQIQLALKDPNINVIYADATQLTEKGRYKVLDNLNLENVNVKVYWKNTPLKLALARNAQREGQEYVPESAIIKMYNSIQDPRKDTKYKYKEVRLI